MTQEEIKSKVMPIVAKYLCKEESKINMTADMYKEYEADSLDTIQIIMDVECQFSISIRDSVVKAIRTPQDIIDEVQRHILD